MKIAAIFMAVLLTLSLTGCMDHTKSRGDASQRPAADAGAEAGRDSGTVGGAGNANGNTGNAGNTTGGASGNTSGGSTGSTNSGGSGSTNSGSSAGQSSGNSGNTGSANSAFDADSENRGSVMFNGALYEVTAERVEADMVGLELFSVADMVDGDPAEDGEAAGLDRGTKVYRIRDDNEYDEVAVEIGDAYYRAVKRR